MLNEPASSMDDERRQRSRSPVPETTVPPIHDALYTEIRDAVETVMLVENEDFSVNKNARQKRSDIFLVPQESNVLMKFTGSLRMDSEAAYDRLDELFHPHDLLPIFRREDEGQPAIYVIQGRVQPKQGGTWLALGLFIATILSVLFVGALMAINQIGLDNPARADALMRDFTSQLWRGWPYAVSILLILGGHEMGHYILARYHKTAASLPYFIPFPFSLFGTFGAAIRLREPMRNRKVLLDVGAAGPLAGLIFAVPILFIGLATSPVLPPEGGLLEGNSILYALAKIIVFGRMLPDGNVDVIVNQLAWAGWTGLLVTGLNLIPIGQLDGGHILYALLGKHARRLFYPVVGALLLLTLFAARELIIFVLLIIFFLGNRHAVPLDDITPLDVRRRNIAIFALVVFALVFVPRPLQETSGTTPTGGDLIGLPVLMITLWLARARVHAWWTAWRSR